MSCGDREEVKGKILRVKYESIIIALLVAVLLIAVIGLSSLIHMVVNKGNF
jgi:hypothetical protein